MATLQDISRETGLSVATVSHALNGRAGYSQATRKLVKRTAADLGYVANPMARALLGKSTKTIGIVWSLGRPNAEGFVREIASRMWRRGYVTYMADGMSDPGACLAILSDFDRRRVDGVVFQANSPLLTNPAIIQHLKRFRAAVAVMNCAFAEPPVDLVVQDEPNGVGQVMDYWWATGRRRPCVIGEAAAMSVMIEPFMAKVREYGWPEEGAVIDTGAGARVSRNFDYYLEGLNRQFEDGRFPFDAVLCAGDDGAAAVLPWLKKRRYGVPEDVAIVGFGNIDLIRGIDPPIASVERHYEPSADAIDEILFERLGRLDQPRQVRTIPSTFIWRESAGGNAKGNNEDRSVAIHKVVRTV
jgi:LacI family transcriptional regulator